MASVLSTSYEPKYDPQAHFLDRPSDWGKWIHDGNLRSGGREGKAIPPHRPVPKRVEVRSKRNSLPDFFPIDDEIGVSQGLKVIVERLEPGVHQFFPLEVEQKGGLSIEGHYFLFVCCHLIDTAIVAERSDVFKSESTPGSKFWHYALLSSLDYEKDLSYPNRHTGKPRVALDQGAIGDRHLWMDRRMLRDPFASDELVARLQEAGLEGFEIGDRVDVFEV